MPGDDPHGDFRAGQALRTDEMHRLEIGGPSTDLAGLATWTGDENGKHFTLTGGVERGLLIAQQRLENLQAAILLRLRHLGWRAGSRRAGPGRIFETEGLREGYLADQFQRRLEIRLGLTGMADDEIRGQRHVRPRRAQLFNDPQIIRDGMLAVHRRQDAIRTRLHRQMQKRHQRRNVAMRGNQIVVHVARVGGGVAQPRQAGDFGQFAQQPPKTPNIPIRRFAMPGIHVLAEQGDLSRALRHQPAGLCQHGGGGAAGFGAACVRHHAERTEFVAAFLNGQKRGDALGGGCFRQKVEFLFGGKIGFDHGAAGTGGLRDHFRQPVIGLRTQHNVHIRRARKDLRTFRLRHTASHSEDHLFPGCLTRQLQQPQAAEFGKHLFRRLVPDMAGVQDHHIGLIGCVDRRIPKRRQNILHPQAVIHVHLAAPGDHVQSLIHRLSMKRWLAGHHDRVSVCLENRHVPHSTAPDRTNPERESGGIVGIGARVKFKVGP